MYFWKYSRHIKLGLFCFLIAQSFSKWGHLELCLSPHSILNCRQNIQKPALKLKYPIFLYLIQCVCVVSHRQLYLGLKAIWSKKLYKYLQNHRQIILHFVCFDWFQVSLWMLVALSSWQYFSTPLLLWNNNLAWIAVAQDWNFEHLDDSLNYLLYV